MTSIIDLSKVPLPKGKITKIYNTIVKKGVRNLVDSDWDEISLICNSINGRFAKDTQKMKCLLSLANPKVSIIEKDKFCSQMGISIAATYRSESSKALIHKFINPSFLEYLSHKYLDKISLVIDVEKLHINELKHLISCNPSFAKKVQNSYSSEPLINTLLQSDMDMKTFLGTYRYHDLITKKLDKGLSTKLAKYDEAILIKNEKVVNEILYKKYPQLELFNHIIVDNEGRFSHQGLKMVKEMEPLNIKDYLKQKYGFSSSKMIHYIKNNFNDLESNYSLSKTLELYKSVISDHNLIWHILDDFAHNKYKKLTSQYFSDNEFLKNKNLLTESQWSLFFKTLNSCLSKEPARTVENIRDSFRMISDVNYNNKNDSFIQLLKDNYRFQEYNTPEKLHEVLIVLYNKAMNKEYPLNLEQQYPNILDQHNFKLTDSLFLNIPKVSTDLTLWGQRLRICVGSYSRNVANGETLVVGITENGIIKYCAEVNPVNIKLIQLRGFRNDDAPSEVFTAFKSWMESFKPSILAAQEHKLKYDLSIITSQVPQLEEFFKTMNFSELEEQRNQDVSFPKLPFFMERRDMRMNSNMEHEIKEYFNYLKNLSSPENFACIKNNLSFISDLKSQHSKILNMVKMTSDPRMDLFGGLRNYLAPSILYFISDTNNEIRQILRTKEKIA